MIRWRRHERADITERFPTESLEGPLLEVTNVETHFETPRGVVHAVDDVSFSLDRGRTLGVVGESGSGKTVLSRSVMGLLPTKHVMIGGQDYEIVSESTEALVGHRGLKRKEAGLQISEATLPVTTTPP